MKTTTRIIACALAWGAIACGADQSDAPTPEAGAEFPATLGTDEPLRPELKEDGAEASPPGTIDPYNDPARIDPTFERLYAALPSSGAAAKTPWTDTYWPKNKGGISYRWQTDTAHDYVSPTRDQAHAMGEDAIALLSPSEKYDLLVGQYEYPLTNRVQSANQRTEASWTGYCHGWTPAAMHFDEPRPVVMVSDDGLRIPFGSADVKALLTYFQGEVVRSTFSNDEVPFRKAPRTVGSLCMNGDPANPGCTDAHPGAFHIVMANMLGLRAAAFGIDVDPTYEKWNQPVHRYATQELARRAPSGGASASAVEEVLVETRITYTQEIEPAWEPVLGTPHHADSEKQYTYTLELDAEGHIVGGQWVTVLEDGTTLTMSEVHEYFATLDENGDGTPDLDRDAAASATWQYINLPDYVWYQDRGEFAPEFQPAYGRYDFLARNVTSRKKLYAYMARLADLYAAATAR